MRFIERPCIWNGVRYPSIKTAARANHLSPPAMHYRLRQEYTNDDEMECYGSVGIACVWNGVQYRSIAAAARVCNISGVAMRYRINRGYTCDDDLQRRS